MVRSLFGNSNRKLRSTFWGSPFIPVGTNQTECCLPLTNFSVPSRFQTRATQTRPFLDSNRNGCSNSAVNWYIAYHYAFDSPNGFFCQMLSTPSRNSQKNRPISREKSQNSQKNRPISREFGSKKSNFEGFSGANSRKNRPISREISGGNLAKKQSIKNNWFRWIFSGKFR